MKSYKLIPFGRGDTAAALCKVCAEGELGESLFREGFNKRRFCEFVYNFVADRVGKQRPAEQIIDGLELIDCSNMSAAKQAFAACRVVWEKTDESGESILDAEGNPTWDDDPKHSQSVEKYWEKAGGMVAKANLSALD